MGAVEMQGFELFERHVLDEAGAVGHALDPLVVSHHQFTAAADMHVQLHAFRAHVRGHLESFQGVFGGITGRAAMPVDVLFHRSKTLPLFMITLYSMASKISCRGDGITQVDTRVPSFREGTVPASMAAWTAATSPHSVT